MGTKIAFICDLHWAESGCTNKDRHGKYADLLLRRALELLRIRNNIDLIILCGDLTDSPSDMHGLKRLREVLKAAPCPFVAIPGNHDPKPEDFFTVFERHDHWDIGNVRLIFFPDDPEMPGYNSQRSAAEMARAHKLCSEFAGRKVFCQHVPLFPPGTPGLHYSYANAAEILAQGARDGVTLAISGHQHNGMKPAAYGATACIAVPALCEEPYSFAVIDLDDEGKTSMEQISLRLPSGRQWHDNHTHSPLAYCNENMDFNCEKELGAMFNISRIGVTEHSGQLYFPEPEYWRGEWFSRGMSSAYGTRVSEYGEYLNKACTDSLFLPGSELDVDAAGNLLCDDSLLRKIKFRIGAIHHIPDIKASTAGDTFLFLAENLIRRGAISVLAHPYRVFSWNGEGEKPAETFAPLIKLLRENNVAAEINFHHNRPDAEFVRQCLAAGVKLSFGSDSHNLYELGFFNPHMEFVRSLGFDGDWDDILI